ncbi:hypothetical protein [Tolypothrix sp. VBCCA 56010]|uniref:hypothetical protein n=1 Tax=Tolypothrix sp. VBCCA 56010 TaxID=3137731 RepID=UPI003D7D3DD1
MCQKQGVGCRVSGVGRRRHMLEAYVSPHGATVLKGRGLYPMVVGAISTLQPHTLPPTPAPTGLGHHVICIPIVGLRMKAMRKPPLRDRTGSAKKGAIAFSQLYISRLIVKTFNQKSY